MDGNGTLRERVRDVLIHAVGLDWAGTKRFLAGNKIWHVRYHKYRAENSRVFSAESAASAGEPERVILWYGKDGELPHTGTGYADKLNIAGAAFQARLDV